MFRAADRFVLWLAILLLLSATGSAVLSEEAIYEDGYRGIWAKVNASDGRPPGGQGRKRHAKYSGGLATFSAKHSPIAIYSPKVNKTFFSFGGAKQGRGHLVNMLSYYDHSKDLVPRPIVVHDKGGVRDPHDNAAIVVDDKGYLWVYVSARNIIRKGFVYRSRQPYDINEFELLSENEDCYPQPWYIEGQGILELFTRYERVDGFPLLVRELYFNRRILGGPRGKDSKLVSMGGGHYQVSFAQGRRLITAFNRHPKANPDLRTDLYYIETRDFGESWQTIDARRISLPLHNSDSPALVRAYSEDDKLVYLQSMTLDRQGSPLILVLTSSSHLPGKHESPRRWEVLSYRNKAWKSSLVTTSTHNYDRGEIWVEPDGSWMVAGPTEPGPDYWGTGGRIALWRSDDRGVSWRKKREIATNAQKNNSYVRKVIGSAPDSPFGLFWADGRAHYRSKSNLYFSDREGRRVRVLPYKMSNSLEKPEVVYQGSVAKCAMLPC